MCLHFASHQYCLSRQSKRLYVWETGPVDDMAMLLLCGDCDFKVRHVHESVWPPRLTGSYVKLISDSAFIDRKIKFHISPKSNVAIKILRSQISTLLAQQFRVKPLSESQCLWFDLALMVLGKTKVEPNESNGQIPTILVNS